MNYREENGRLIICPEGKIDSVNAASAEQEIMQIISEHGGMPVAFDAEKLEYISSAGLRVLLKVRKLLGEPVEVLNASKDVYDIFELTGFTELLTVHKALRKVSVAHMQLIGKGMTGAVYRADKETVIKVFHPNINFDLLIKQENKKAKNAFIAGVPTAIPYDIVRVGDCYGTVYELLNAKDLVEVIAEDKAYLDDYIRMFARTVKSMHAIKVSPALFQVQKKASIDALPRLSSVLNEEEMQKFRAVYENIPDRCTFIHGDCNIGNAMLQNGELMFIDLATCGMGHPIFDMTSMYSLFVERAGDDQAIAASPVLSRFTKDEIARVWNVFIRTYLDTDDEALIHKVEEQIAALSLARKLFAVIAMSGLLSPEMIDAMKRAVIAYYDRGLEPICF